MNAKALTAEFLGTFALIFVGVGAIAANQLTGGALGLTGIALAHGLTIAVMVSAAAAVSGGHLNPAVTFGAFLGGKIDAKGAAGYVLAQTLGAIAGALAITAAVPSSALAAVAMGVPAVGRDVSTMQAFVTETILTFFLVFTVYGTAIDKRAPKVGGLFIGLAVALGVMMGGPVSGAAMNPARHLGPALVGGMLADSWLYWVAPLTGGAIAGLLYHNLLEER